MNNYNFRTWQAMIFLISLSVLMASFYFQYVKNLQPCPLCIMQRVGVFLEVILCFIALVINRVRAYRIIAILQALVALSGLYFAGRQLWLQSLPPDQLSVCLPGLDVLWKYFPWRDIFHALLWGAADCAEVTWQFLGLSMPAWVFLYFTGILSAAVFVVINTNHAKR